MRDREGGRARKGGVCGRKGGREEGGMKSGERTEGRENRRGERERETLGEEEE